MSYAREGYQNPHFENINENTFADVCEMIARVCRCRLQQKPLLLHHETRTNLSAHEKFHHSVYVILLDSAVVEHPSILRLNPGRDPSKPAVYVGMTGLPVEHRFENHQNGYKSSWVVKKYAVRLMPELYEHLNPMPFEAAAQMEEELADELRTAGYTVTGGH